MPPYAMPGAGYGYNSPQMPQPPFPGHMAHNQGDATLQSALLAVQAQNMQLQQSLQTKKMERQHLEEQLGQWGTGQGDLSMPVK
jgi:hypothetical protein